MLSVEPMPSVFIIMGSKSDLPVVEKATAILGKLGIDFGVAVASAHRTPRRVEELVKGSDAKVFIAVAGMSAALPGVMASFTTKPVIGVPVSGKMTLDALLSVVQMPPGIPVAAVGLDRGDNAAILAAEILAVGDVSLVAKLASYRDEMAKKVEEDSEQVISDVGC
jgi:5-(carboxyamino)imidazole ribonucleotide mutase